jgi:hypothetical protein
MLPKILSFLLENGCSRADLVEALRDQAACLEAGRAPQAPEVSAYNIWLRVSGVVYEWCSDASFTQSDGKPIALKLDGGERSLQSLIRRRFRDDKVEDVVAWMITNGVVYQDSDGMFVLREGSLLIADSESLALVRLLTLSGQYLATALNNLRLKDRSQRTVDRTARVFYLPKKFLPQFHAMVTELTQSYLDSIDDWLEGRNAPRTNEETVEAGVHSYAYSGEYKDGGTFPLTHGRSSDDGQAATGSGSTTLT